MSRAAVDAFYLPRALSSGVETAVHRFGPAHDAAEIRLPVPAPGDILRWVEALRRARAERLAERPIASILRPLERVVARYLDPKDRARRSLIVSLGEVGRFSRPMVERALEDAFEPLAKGGLRQWIASELGSIATLDRPTPSRDGVLRRAIGPEVMLQIYAGNVPTVPVWPLFSALLLKSAVLAKTSAQEPVLAPSLARAIAEEDPDLAQCMAVVWWKGGAAELDRAALSVAPAVLAFGGDVAIASISRLLLPSAKAVLHGPKVSLAYIGRGALARATLADLARRAALDVAQFDQQGCLSPHAFYVERGAGVSPVDFATALGKALEGAADLLPRRQPTRTEAASLQLYRAEARLRSAANPDTRVLTSPSGTGWSVICENGARFEPGPAHRTVRVHSIAGPDELERAVAREVRYVEALALEERGARRAALASRFAGLGIARIAGIGSLQRPSPLGAHGGQRRLLPFVTWSTVDLLRRSLGRTSKVRKRVSKPSTRRSRKGARLRPRSR